MPKRNKFFTFYEDFSRKKQKCIRGKFQEKNLSWTSFLQKHSYKKLDRLTAYLIVQYIEIFEVSSEEREKIIKKIGLS